MMFPLALAIRSNPHPPVSRYKTPARLHPATVKPRFSSQNDNGLNGASLVRMLLIRYALLAGAGLAAVAGFSQIIKSSPQPAQPPALERKEPAPTPATEKQQPHQARKQSGTSQ